MVVIAGACAGSIVGAMTLAGTFLCGVNFWPAVGYAWEAFTTVFLVVAFIPKQKVL